jgi:group I intron endonuclease
MDKLFDNTLSCVTNSPGIYYLKVNESNYIGSSINLKIRLQQHKNDMFKGSHDNPRLQRTFNKYGVEKVWYSILETLDNVSPLELLEIEKKWIDLLGPVLNVKLDPVTEYSAITTSKRVYQFDKQGRLINSYASTKEAERITKVKSSSIVRVCGKHLLSAGGYLWSYDERASVSYDLERSKWKWKAVVVEDTLTGEITTYNNIAKAARCLELDNKKFDSVCATISSLCNGRGKLLKNRYKCNYVGSDFKIL